MQEYEHVYEQEYRQEQEQRSVQEFEQEGTDLTEQVLEPIALTEEQMLEPIALTEEEVFVEFSDEGNEHLEEMQDQRATLHLGRVLVVCLGLSFLASLAAFWFSGTLLSPPDQILPLAFLQTLAANRILVLSAPIICLVVCYVALRSLTSEIMAVPERKLDERQKMLRDQAHRSAFKIVKLSSLLIPVAVALPYLPWFNSAASPVFTPGGVSQFGRSHYFFPQGKVTIFDPAQGFPGGAHRFLRVEPAVIAYTQPPAAPPVQPASGPEIAIAVGLLALGILVVFSALPMAVLAWKGKA